MKVQDFNFYQDCGHSLQDFKEGTEEYYSWTELHFNFYQDY
jgi:hypothetical protein